MSKRQEEADVFLWTPAVGSLPPIAVVTGPRGQVTGYYLVEDREADASFGRCWRVEKFTRHSGTDPEGRAYSVTLGTAEQMSCTCRGWLRWRTPCRHIRACLLVLQGGGNEQDAALRLAGGA
jgi:hypothetical protein